MPVVGAAGITAAAAVGVGLIGSHDAAKGRAAQQKSADAALDYEKGRNQVDDKRYDTKMKLYQDYLADYRARHGGATGGSGSTGAPPSQSSVSISDLVNSQQGASPGPGAQAQPGSVADMVNGGDVFDWRRYGA